MTETPKQEPKSKLSRLLTAAYESFPMITGRLQKHEFVASKGASINFKRVSSDFKQDGFFASFEGRPSYEYWDAQELRDLAQECIYLADHLEKSKKKGK